LTTRLAVLGSPISHSKSPLLHAAAYRQLGLDWQYEAIEITGDSLADFVRSRTDEWRGLSLTMPLKRDVLPLLTVADRLVTQTGGANTVLFDGGIHGFNTDVYGITEAFRAAGVQSLDRVQILGGGATAASALAAVAALGATHAQFALRDPAKGAPLERLGETLEVNVVVRPFGLHERSMIVPDAVISTLPGHSEHDLVFSEPTRAGAVLFDVAYDPWPSRLASAWLGTVISGLEMLTLQALAQVRVFVNGDPGAALPNEAAVLAAMKRAATL
jgi:shikimate dehydrogenase